MAKQELLATIRDRYRASSKREKSRILDEFIPVTGHHRKHGIRLLGQSGDDGEQQPAAKKGRRIYDESVRQAVIVVWEAADRICGKRLKAALPHLVESMERHGHLDLDPGVRQRLLAASAATLDRLLQPIRPPAGRRLRRRRNQSPGRNIPVRTFADWNAPPPGFLEIDLVVHHGGSWWGSMIHSLVATDICTGWTEAVPLLAREQSLVVAGLEAIGRQLPCPFKGIDSDNDNVFINDTLTQYCAERGIEFTRSRPYRKNDQAWIEQKNGAVVRHCVGHDRYSGAVAGPTMAHLYGASRRYVNYFQPSFKLVGKTRHGSRVVKRYRPPATPCDRLMQHDAVSVEMKEALSEYRVQLDPVALLHAIREAQSALAAVTSPRNPAHSQRREPGTVPGQVGRLVAAGCSAYLTGAAGATAPHLANSARPFRRSVVRRAVLVAGRPGRQCGGIAGPTARGRTGSFQPGSPAYVAAQGAAVARHHGQKAGLRHGW